MHAGNERFVAVPAPSTESAPHNTLERESQAHAPPCPAKRARMASSCPAGGLRACALGKADGGGPPAQVRKGAGREGGPAHPCPHVPATDLSIGGRGGGGLPGDVWGVTRMCQRSEMPGTPKGACACRCIGRGMRGGVAGGEGRGLSRLQGALGPGPRRRGGHRGRAAARHKKRRCLRGDRLERRARARGGAGHRHTSYHFRGGGGASLHRWGQREGGRVRRASDGDGGRVSGGAVGVHGGRERTTDG